MSDKLSKKAAKSLEALIALQDLSGHGKLFAELRAGLETHIGQQQIIDNRSEDSQTLEEYGVKIAENREEILGNAYEIDQEKKESNEPSKPEIQKKNWEKDIALKEQKLQEDHQKQLEAFEHNNLLLKIQKEDAKKFSDPEKKLENLAPMDEFMKQEKENIQNKFEKATKEIQEEKEACQTGINREDFEKQKEIERDRSDDDDRDR